MENCCSECFQGRNVKSTGAGSRPCLLERIAEACSQTMSTPIVTGHVESMGYAPCLGRNYSLDHQVDGRHHKLTVGLFNLK